MFATLPDGRRPSDCAITLAGTFQSAVISGPGRLCIVPLSCTPTLGTVPIAMPRISV